MIIYNENYADIYKQMSAERDKAQYYTRKFEKKALSDWKNMRPPCLYYKTQQMPESLNTYLYYYYAMTDAEVMDNCCFCGNILLLNDDKGRQMSIRLMTVREMFLGRMLDRIDSLQIFTSHFFTRYRERFSNFENLSTNDLIATFAGRNLGYLHAVEYDKFVLPKDRKNNGAAWGIDDGFTLGEKHLFNFNGTKVMVAKHNTYIGRSILKDSQHSNVFTQEQMRSLLTYHFNKRE